MPQIAFRISQANVVRTATAFDTRFERDENETDGAFVRRIVQWWVAEQVVRHERKVRGSVVTRDNILTDV